jgi:hypothetical protein
MKMFPRPWVRRLYMLLACLILVSAPGCVIIPLPEHGLLYGRGKIEEADIAFLKIGETSREDVVLRFGQPDVILFDQRILAYSWAVSVGYWAVAGGGNAAVGAFPKHYLLMLEFNDEGRLRRAEMASSWLRQNLHKEALKWFETLDLAVSKAPPMLVGEVIPPGESAFYIYRETSFWDRGKVPWEVRVDRKAVGWLRKGEYIAITLAPGAHVVAVIISTPSLNENLVGASINFKALPGQAHYVSVEQPQWSPTPFPDPVLTVRSEGEALPMLKKMPVP